MEESIQQLTAAINGLEAVTILDWAPIFLSVVAVIVAIYVPSRIASKQNNISIFDKLYDAYSQLLQVRAFANAIKDYSFSANPLNVQRIRALTCVHFESHFYYKPDIDNPYESIGSAVASLRRNEVKGHMLPLLVSKDASQKKLYDEMIAAIYEPLFLLITEVILFDPAQTGAMDVHLKSFVENTESFFNKYSEQIENTLLCNK